MYTSSFAALIALIRRLAFTRDLQKDFEFFSHVFDNS